MSTTFKLYFRFSIDLDLLDLDGLRWSKLGWSFPISGYVKLLIVAYL